MRLQTLHVLQAEFPGWEGKEDIPHLYLSTLIMESFALKNSEFAVDDEGDFFDIARVNVLGFVSFRFARLRYFASTLSHHHHRRCLSSRFPPTGDSHNAPIPDPHHPDINASDWTDNTFICIIYRRRLWDFDIM